MHNILFSRKITEVKTNTLRACWDKVTIPDIIYPFTKKPQQTTTISNNENHLPFMKVIKSINSNQD